MPDNFPLLYHFIFVLLQICAVIVLWICRLFQGLCCFIFFIALILFQLGFLPCRQAFSFRSIMPPRRSQQACAPSSTAINAATATEPHRKRPRTSFVPSTSALPSANVSGQMPEQPPSLLTANMMDQLVYRVVQEVTKYLSPAECNEGAVPATGESALTLPPTVREMAPPMSVHCRKCLLRLLQMISRYPMSFHQEVWPLLLFTWPLCQN